VRSSGCLDGRVRGWGRARPRARGRGRVCGCSICRPRGVDAERNSGSGRPGSYASSVRRSSPSADTPLFSSSPYTARQGIGASFPGYGGFSPSAGDLTSSRHRNTTNAAFASLGLQPEKKTRMRFKPVLRFIVQLPLPTMAINSPAPYKILLTDQSTTKLPTSGQKVA
jgi:hypothetical protein